MRGTIGIGSLCWTRTAVGYFYGSGIVDHPEDKPVVPPEHATRPDAASSGTAPAPGKPESIPPLERWHEPPVEEGSSRPVIVETWFTPQSPPKPEPDQAAPPAADEGVPPQAEVSARERGDWFTPLDAQVDALLAGADQTIPEIHVAEEAQPQAPGDTQPEPAATEVVSEPVGAVGDATAVAGSTPLPEETPLPAETSAETPPEEEQEAPAPDLSRFEQVEQQVRALRERYQAGEITREAADELRS